MSLVPTGTFIPKGERWGGSPCVKVGVVTPAASGMKVRQCRGEGGGGTLEMRMDEMLMGR